MATEDGYIERHHGVEVPTTCRDRDVERHGDAEAPNRCDLPETLVSIQQHCHSHRAEAEEGQEVGANQLGQCLGE